MIMSHIRDYRRDDFDALVALYQHAKGDEFRFEPGFPERFSVIPLPLDEARLKAFGESEALVVEAEEGLAGAIYWQSPQIVGLLVAPDSRGAGIGRALMAGALARVGETAALDVVASNAPAIRLYESLCFQEVGQRKGFYQGVPVTVLMMRRGPEE